MRVTRLDGCGRPDESDPDAVQVTTDGFVSIEVTANTEEGDAITVTNAAGRVCVNQQPCPTFNGYAVNITFCDVDPDLFALTTGMPSVLDGNGDGVGFRVNSDISVCDSGYALEVWSKVPGVVCDPGGGGEVTSGYLLFPFLQGGVFGDFTIENDAVSFNVQGATTKTGSGWGVGPYDVILDDTGTAGPLLAPIEKGDHLHVQLTEVAPPQPSCGAGPLVIVDATGATAGTPGTYAPAGAQAPADLADLRSQGVTATPTTAWTAGQSIELNDGSDAHWDGNSWESGTA
jgi:hypothetical protein